jgi:sugar phosphate isomerase/epimerase
MSRRTLVGSLALAPLARLSAAGRTLLLGGPVFLKSDDPAALAREHRRLGYNAAYCPEARAADTHRTEAIRHAFSAANVVIAEVGAWKNMLDPDPAARRANLAFVTERLALAEAVAARCCVDIAGSYNPKSWFGMHPKNLSREFFDATVENTRKVIDAVKPTRTHFALEMMPWSLPDGPDSYLELLKAIDRPAFGVHLDVCNAINCPERFYNNKALIEDCFRKLGPWLLSCHAKDLAWLPEYNIHFAEVIPGRGVLDYAAFLTHLPPTVPLMLEHLATPEDYREAADHIRRQFRGQATQSPNS